MCQKASGGFYLPLVTVRDAKLTWTRGEPQAVPAPPNAARRGFCGECGTPLALKPPRASRWPSAPSTSPAAIAPMIQWGIEAKLPYVDGITGLPARTRWPTIEWRNYLATLVSYQHPDHDTEDWPRKGETK